VYVPSSGLGLSQPLSRQRVCLSPQNQGGGGWGANSPAGEGLGKSQFRRLEKRLSTLPTLWHVLRLPFFYFPIPITFLCCGFLSKLFFFLYNFLNLKNFRHLRTLYLFFILCVWGSQILCFIGGICRLVDETLTVLLLPVSFPTLVCLQKHLTFDCTL
jgi:hypothetical protein